MKTGKITAAALCAALILMSFTSCSGLPRGVLPRGGLLGSSGIFSAFSHSSSGASSHSPSHASSKASSQTSSQASSQASSAASSAASSQEQGGGGGGGDNGDAAAQAAAAAAAAAAAQAAAWPASGGVPSPMYVPNLDGRSVFNNGAVYIDLSYVSYGFVKIHLLQPSGVRVKVQIRAGATYTYDLNQGGATETFPLQMGSGSYSISVLKNIGGTSYSYLGSTNVGVSLAREDAPFLIPCQIVNYSSGTAGAIAQSLVGGKSNNYERISAVCSYVAEHIRYNYGLAQSVTTGYVPNIDADIASGSGICYDYAAVTAGMLRSLGYPTKLIMGYSGGVYHAWNEVYLSGQGWIKVMSVKVNMGEWSRVDVTFVSTATSPADIERYIANSGNYQTTKIY
jgi:hypothetical protein